MKKVFNYLKSIRWLLFIYDVLLYTLVYAFFIFFSSISFAEWQIYVHFGIYLALIFIFRMLWRVYRQIWRYGGIQSYLRLIFADLTAMAAYIIIDICLMKFYYLMIPRAIMIFATYLLGCLVYRMMYRYIYKCVKRDSKFGKFIFGFINIFGRSNINLDSQDTVNKIKVAIFGAGSVGTSLAEELLTNKNSNYVPRLFIDDDKDKIGREISGIAVKDVNDVDSSVLHHYEIQEVIFAVSHLKVEEKKRLYELYKGYGLRLKTYDYPDMQNASSSSKRKLREFDIEELLFRAPLNVTNDKTTEFYKNKVILVTGGGGSIGSEICRQIAKMEPKQIIVLDIYENCAYDIQQELKIKYKDALDLKVEICSITNRPGLEKVFKTYRPNIVIMAAAHKHVPLMEHNVIEAVDNNVFGTLNTVLLAEQYNVDRVHMVSTDKSVNPTSIMGATKRICEMIVQSHSKIEQHTTFSITRFGNVLGSAGSVIPLFKKEIANGGPVTITDKRIIRYFMTIPEASQLVLTSASMAKNGELFALDMGEPVKILDLAENMIRLAGYEPDVDIKIEETGLRPGEKLYEELLIKTEELDKTDNELIFIERDEPISLDELDIKLNSLQKAVDSNDDELARTAVIKSVPTFVDNRKVNSEFTGNER